MKNRWIIAEDTSLFVFSFLFFFFLHHVTMILKHSKLTARWTCRWRWANWGKIKLKRPKKQKQCALFCATLVWWTAVQSVARHAPQKFLVCVRADVSEWVIQLRRFGNTEPCSQAILAGGVGVRQDTSPRGEEMRGSRDDGELGGFCAVVTAWTSNNPGALSAAEIWPDCVYVG